MSKPFGVHEDYTFETDMMFLYKQLVNLKKVMILQQSLLFTEELVSWTRLYNKNFYENRPESFKWSQIFHKKTHIS